MAELKRHLFWVVLGVVTLLSLAAWFLLVGPVQANAEALREECNNLMGKLERLRANKDKILTQEHVECARKFKEHVSTQKSQVLELWKEKQLRLEPAFEAARDPGMYLARFHGEWLKNTREKILKLQDGNGVKVLVPSFQEGMLFGDQTTTTSEAERVQRIYQLQLIHEVLSRLNSVSESVTRKGFEPDLGKAEPDQAGQARVLTLDQLRLVQSDEEQKKRAAGEIQAGWNKAGNSVSNLEAQPRAYKAMRIELTFTAEPAAVCRALQALEGSQVYYGVLRRLDTRRLAAPYPQPAQFDQLLPKPDQPAPVGTYLNSRFKEAPVQVFAVLDLLNLDGEELNKIVSAKPKSEKAEGAKAKAGAKSKAAK